MDPSRLPPNGTTVSPVTILPKKQKNVAGFRVDRSTTSGGQSTSANTGAEAGTSGTSTPAQPRSAPPLPKKNKGQLFLAFIFLAFFFSIFYAIYAAFFQYKAYGVVSGRLIEVGAPWDGTVSNWQVRDGDIVQQGQILAVIANIEMEHRLQTLDDELRYAQAQVDAEASRIKFNFSDKADRNQKALAEYLEAQGNLLAEQSTLSNLEQRLKRSTKLRKAGNVSQQSYDELYYQCDGQRQKVAKLVKAVEVLRQRAEDGDSGSESKASQLDPLLVKIEQIQSERERLRARIDLGRIVAPVSGRVTLRTLLTGESVRQGETIVEILEDNSAEAVLYVPQIYTGEFKVGERIMLTLEPFDKEVPCIVKRIGNQFQPAPGSIERFYQKQQHLLPIHLSPVPELREEFSLRINGTVKLPYSWNEWVSDTFNGIKDRFCETRNDENEGEETKEQLPEPVNQIAEVDQAQQKLDSGWRESHE